MIHLPFPVAAYVEATNHQDAARVAACFTREGTVRDEGTVRRGGADIAAWVRETSTRYQFRIEPVGVMETDGHCRLEARVSGNFPGSPATLQFHFALQPEGIASLEISA